MAYINDGLKDYPSLDIEDEVSVEDLLNIYHHYHHKDANFEEGLGFLDRLHKKLSLYFPIQWDIPAMKKIVQESGIPQLAYVNLLREILTQEMIDVYGV